MLLIALTHIISSEPEKGSVENNKTISMMEKNKKKISRLVSVLLSI